MKFMKNVRNAFFFCGVIILLSALFSCSTAQRKDTPRIDRVINYSLPPDQRPGYQDSSIVERPLEMIIQAPHGSAIQAIAWSPDGQYIVSGDMSHVVKLWRVSDGRLIRTFTGHTEKVTDLAWRPDGKSFLSAGGNLCEWSMSGDLIQSVSYGKFWNYTHLAIPGDNSFLITGSGNGLFLWEEGFPDESIDAEYNKDSEIEMFRMKRNIREEVPARPFSHAQAYNVTMKMALHPDEKTILWGGFRALELFTVQGELIWAISDLVNNVRGLAFLPDGKSFLCAHDDNLVELRDTATGAVISQVRIDDPDGSQNFILDLAVSPDGTEAVVGSNILSRLNLPDLSESVLSGKSYDYKVVYSRDGKQVALGGPDLTLLNRGTQSYKPMGTYDVIAEHFTISPDGNNLLVGNIHGIRNWNLDGGVNESYKYNDTPVDGAPFWIGGSDDEFMSWDRKTLRWHSVGTGEILREKELPIDKNLYSVHITPGGTIIAADWSSMVYILDGNGEISVSIDAMEEDSESRIMNSVAVSPAEERIACLRRDEVLTFWDFQGNLLSRHEDVWGLRAMEFSRDGKHLWISSDGGIIHFDCVEGKLDGSLSLDRPGRIRSIDVSRDDRFVLSGSSRGFIDIYDRNKGVVDRSIETEESIEQVSFGPDEGTIIYSTENRTVVHNIETGKEYSLVFSRGNWAAFDTGGYFEASANGGHLVTMNRGMLSYGIDQFAIQYNRPDLLFAGMNRNNRSRLDHYYAQYQKRLAKAGITEGQLTSGTPLPQVWIQSVQSDGETARLSMTVYSEDIPLKTFQLFVNGIPIYSGMGKPLEGNEVRLEESVDLVSDINRIEVSCFNQAGQESLRETVLAPGDEKQGDLYFIGFGVSRYRDSRLDLKYAHQDVVDLAEALQRQGKKHFENLHLHTFTDGEVTRETIGQAKSILNEAKPEDTFVLFIAGHGIHDNGENATYYYLTHETDLEDLADTAVTFEEIELLLQDIQPRKKLFLMDTCESGEAEPEQENRIVSLAGARGLTARTVRGLSVKNGTEEVFREQRRDYLLERDRYIYNSLTRRTGAVVISSSRGGEFSYEKDSLHNGVFTEALVKALQEREADSNRDKRILLDELRLYLPAEVSRETAGLQNPTVDRDNLYLEMSF